MVKENSPGKSGAINLDILYLSLLEEAVI